MHIYTRRYAFHQNQTAQLYLSLSILGDNIPNIFPTLFDSGIIPQTNIPFQLDHVCASLNGVALCDKQLLVQRAHLGAKSTIGTAGTIIFLLQPYSIVILDYPAYISSEHGLVFKFFTPFYLSSNGFLFYHPNSDRNKSNPVIQHVNR